MSDIENNFRKNLKKFLNETNTTQEELAKYIGVSTSAVSNYAQGLNMPRMNKIDKICEFFHINRTDLLENNSDKQTNKISLPSQKYNLLQNTAGAGLLDYKLDIGELDTIDVPDQFLGRYAGRQDVLIVKVNGESMNKIIPDQSYVGIIYKDYDYIPQTGDIIVYRFRGEGLGVKRFIDMYDEVMLKPESTNKIYKERRFRKDTADDFEILGKVIMYNVTLD